MAAAARSSSSAILLNGGIAGMCVGASGLLHGLSTCRELGGDPGVAQVVLGLHLLALFAGEAMALYALLQHKCVVPAVSPGLAKKLFWIPVVLFAVALAIQVPLLASAMLFRLDVVGNGRALPGRPLDEAAGGILEGDAGDGDGDGVGVHEDGQ